MRAILLALALLSTGCIVEAQAAPRDVRATVTIVADTATVTVRWTPPPGNYDGFAVELRMAGRPVQAAVAPRAGAVAMFRVLRPDATGEACVAATRATRRGNESCTAVAIQWPEEPIPDVGGVTVEIEVGAITPPPDTTEPDPGPPPVVVGIPQPESDGNAELPRLWVNTAMTPTLRTVPVTSCTALQPALDGARDGDRIALTAGLTCTGNWVLRGQHSTPVIVTTETVLPDEGVRARPSTSGSYATLVARSVEPAIRTQGPVEGWRVMGLHVRPDTTHSVNWALIRVGTGSEISVDSQPRNVILDRLYVTAHDSIDIQRCIAIEGRYIAVVNSWIAGCHYKGADAQAVISWNSVGPHAIRNNRLEGSGENVMWGGQDPRIPGAVACDLDVRGNHFIKPDAWYDRNGANPYTEKNLFELKNSCRVLVENNVFEGNWQDGQIGHAIVLKSSNQSGKCTWCVTHDVTFRWNHIKDSPSGTSFHRLDDYSGMGGIPMHHITYANNLHTGYLTYAGARRLWQITGAQQVLILRNTATDPGLSNTVMMDGTPSQGSAIKDNLLARGNYGIFGSSKGEGTNAINYFLPDGVVTGNIMVGTTCAGFVYPAGNTCVTTIPTTTTAGVDQAELMKRLEGVVVAP